jgi:hypothetical protein
MGAQSVASVCPSLWTRRFPNEAGRDGDQHAAHAVAAWLQRADRGALSRYFNPPLEPEERAVAGFEGWILGVA